MGYDSSMCSHKFIKINLQKNITAIYNPEEIGFASKEG